jgi:hypothetical protein
MEMNENQALNDLKAIRQIMDRTRRAAAGDSGWFTAVGGIIWLLGFLGHQFLPEHLVGWTWVVVNTGGMLTIAWLWTRLERQGNVSSPMMRPIMLAWLALGVFDVLFIWLFEMETIYHVPMLILITIALGYAQIGLLFSQWPLCAIGVALVALVVGAFLLAQAYFFLIVALLGGGLMIGTGLWMVRSGKSKERGNGS